MPLGEEGDFRTVGFQMKPMFPGQDQVGGTGSVLLKSFTPPQGRSNNSLPVPGLTVPALNFPGITFPGITFPNQLPPISISGTGGGGTATGTVKVYGGSTVAPTDATEILFNGTALNDVAVVGGVATVTYDSSGGGGGGTTTLKYGVITGVSQPSATVAYWDYTIAEYSAGVANGTTYTAHNLLEWGNTSTFAYGYAIASGSGNRLSTTPASSFYLSAVPVGTMVRLENTSAVGSGGYWFSAPNPITGGC
jgi:hypothetical protein